VYHGFGLLLLESARPLQNNFIPIANHLYIAWVEHLAQLYVLVSIRDSDMGMLFNLRVLLSIVKKWPNDMGFDFRKHSVAIHSKPVLGFVPASRYYRRLLLSSKKK
jgi:hypothetical protein